MMRALHEPGRPRPIPAMPVRPKLDDVMFCAWIAQAAPGESLVYHRGFLGIDILPVISTLPEPERRRLADLAQAAHRAFEQGLVHLVQERLGHDRFAYIAVARPRPRPAAAALSALLREAQAA